MNQINWNDIQCGLGFPHSSGLKKLPAVQEMQVWSLGQEDLLEEDMATHSSILAGRIPQRVENSRLQSIGSPRVGHDWSDLAWTMWVYIFYFLDYMWDEFLFYFIIYLNCHYCGLSYLFVFLIFQLDFKFYYLFLWVFNIIQGFPPSSVGKESACNSEDMGSIPGLGRSPGEGNGKPL